MRFFFGEEEEGRNALQQASDVAASNNRAVDMLRDLMLVLSYYSISICSCSFSNKSKMICNEHTRSVLYNGRKRTRTPLKFACTRVLRCFVVMLQLLVPPAGEPLWSVGRG